MTGSLPQATVIVPARNEAADLAACIDAIGCQDFPLDRLEVLVVDGGSTDGTPEVATQALAGHPFGHATVLINSEGSTPSNLNTGLRHARGEVICRVDARSLIQPHYVRTCVEVLCARQEVAVVGGTQSAVTRDDRALAQAIARALNNPYVMGLSRYRRDAGSGPSDTVYLGAFRRADLLAVGGWDERFPTNQDFELNRRMASRGMVWFDASLRTGYLPRAALGDLWQQYRRFGRWKVRYWRATGDRPRPRQVTILAAGSLGVLVALWLFVRAPVKTTALAAGSALAVDALGSETSVSMSTRALTTVAMSLVAFGWISGVWSELLNPRYRTTSTGLPATTHSQQRERA